MNFPGKSLITKFWPLIFLSALTLFFFRPFVFSGRLPISADTIVGMYHPFRDVTWDNLTAGVPFKNFLITDPVRQQYPWRELAIDSIKNGQWPLWNPYSFSGTPLLANLQSAPFYPLNFLFFILPFNLTWGILIFLEPLLAGTFLYFYLRHLNLEKLSSLLGAISFSFSGFFISWLEWGTILHSVLWLPLMLLSIDKLFSYSQSLRRPELKIKNSVKIKNYLIWSAVFIFSLSSSFLAGHLQTFFYVGIVSVIYILARWQQYGRNFKVIFLFSSHYLLFIILTAFQWIQTFQFISLSGRGLDQADWQKEGWFIPWQNLVQFLAPDFFGNPVTLNYWGVWNYAEFVGYIGILPLILAIHALFWRQDKKTLFFGTVFFLSLLFAFPTPLAKITYQLQIPFLFTSQPTRLLFLVVFSLTALAALGMDHLVRHGLTKKGMTAVLLPFVVVFLGLWSFVVFVPQLWPNIEWATNLAVSKRNLILPTGLFAASVILLSFLSVKRIPKILILVGMMLVVVFDLMHFGQKFTPFAKEEWIFPKTKTIEFLQNQEKPFRIMSADSRIFPPNFSMVYRLESVEGYDPLYLSRYGELIAASERKEPNISPPFGFNRIITPHNFESRIMDLLNVKYVLSLEELKSSKLKKVFQEGETRVYQNLNVLPRAFFAAKVKVVRNRQEALGVMFAADFDPQKLAVVEGEEKVSPDLPVACKKCQVKIVNYRENRVIIETENENDGFLVLADSFYPMWRVGIDGMDGKIYRTNYHLRGVIVPAGSHLIKFSTSLF